jgi:hypothetical protein
MEMTLASLGLRSTKPEMLALLAPALREFFLSLWADTVSKQGYAIQNLSAYHLTYERPHRGNGPLHRTSEP